jgi:hypothetical protein
MSRSVLVTGSRSLAALDIAREFKRNGYRVHVGDSMGGLGARFSRFIDDTHRYPSPALHFEAFSMAMANLVQAHPFDLVVPTCEEIFHLARLGPDHPVAPILFAPHLSVLRALHDKAAFVETCASLGILVPETRLAQHTSDLADLADTAESWVLKPCFSRFGTDTRVSPSAAALMHLSPQIGRPWIAQRRIYGEEICFHAVARNGLITAFVAYAGSWRLEKGASISFSGVAREISDQARTYGEALAAKFSFTGQFACDGLVDDENRLWLIECNPRATSGVHLMAGSGALARAMVETQARGPFVPHGRTHHHILPAMLTLGLAQAIAAKKLKHWWDVFRIGTDVVGIAGDRLPLLGATLDGLAFMWLGSRHRCTATAATTYDIEWNGEI